MEVSMLKRFSYGVLIVVGCLFVDATGLIIRERIVIQSEVIAAGACQKGDSRMEIYLSSEDIKEIRVHVGERIMLESLRQAVVPPYVMIMPFYVLPDFIHYVESRPLDEDGVHGTIFVLDAHTQGQGELKIGFKDIQSGEVTHEKVLSVTVTE
jgi:hypothetical protein